MLFYKQIANDVLLARKICFYLENGIIPSEKEILLQQLGALALSDNLQVKIIIAKSLCHSPYLSAEIVALLCREQTIIAAPLLQYSPQLTEDAIIKLIHHFKSPKKILFLARRKDITPSLANILIKLGHTDIILELLRNKHFTASTSQISRIIKSHAHNRTLIDEIIDNPNFDETEWQDVLYNLDNHLRQEISALIYNKVNPEASQYCYVQQHMVSMQNIGLQQHLDMLYTKGMLDSYVLFSLLREGEVHGFVFGIAKIVEASFCYVRRELIEKWDETIFMRFYCMAELPIEAYDITISIFELIHQNKREHKFSSKECATLIQNKLIEMGGNQHYPPQH